MSAIFMKNKTVATGETHLSLNKGKFKVIDKDLNTLYEHLVEDYSNDRPYYYVEKITQPFKLYVDVEKQPEDMDIC